jgi:ABC-2 type transport system ATP-binding protein
MTSHAAILVEELTKRYGARTAVDKASFEVPAGSVAGFVGPNGAGKSTTLRMLLGLVRPTSGHAFVLGHPITNPTEYMHNVGALIEGPAFYPSLSGHANLEVFATLGSVPRTRIDEVLDVVELRDRAHDAFRTYSLGMKQRLGIALALMRDPALVVLDEPTNGLDPAGIRDTRALVERIAASGPTVFLSSHLLTEIQSVCAWIVILERGQLLFEGRTQALLDGGTTGFIVRTERADDIATLAQIASDGGYASERVDGRLRITAPPGFIAELSRQAADAQIVLTEITPVQTTLEERFLEITRRQA